MNNTLAFLPGHDFFISTGILSENQMKYIAVVQYSITIIIVITAVFWACNVKKIIFKERKHKVLPLLIFYILAFMNISLRLYSNIWFFDANASFYLSILLQIPTISFLIALGQSWTNIELSLSMSLANSMSRRETV